MYVYGIYMYVYGGVEDNRSKNYLMHGMVYASRVGKVGRKASIF